MSGKLTQAEVLKQSKTVIKQFGESKWLPNAKENVKGIWHNSAELMHCGVGKVLLCVGMGESLEKNFEEIKANRSRFDIACCDKAFKEMALRGVIADFVVICDASIPFRFLEGAEQYTENVKLLATPYANPEWTKAWKGPVYYSLMLDSIESERMFYPIFGSNLRSIPAGSNVSNAVISFFLGCTDENRSNWAGYEQYLLVGYDYSWRPDGNYYAWSNPTPKRFYMNHRTLLDMNNDVCFTSENLYFSARWMFNYQKNFKMPLINCSERGLLDIPNRISLSKILARLNTDRSLTERVRAAFDLVKKAGETFELAKNAFNESRRTLLWQ